MLYVLTRQLWIECSEGYFNHATSLKAAENLDQYCIYVIFRNNSNFKFQDLKLYIPSLLSEFLQQDFHLQWTLVETSIIERKKTHKLSKTNTLLGNKTTFQWLSRHSQLLHVHQRIKNILCTCNSGRWWWLNNWNVVLIH